eukprot:CAMPEP_0113664782 /NCGR_PEP_ID=MMETSP0038_2-20120614/1932_1 /TAXON_ID=2898 /ORGANISM="Cryptomonas paramecium" /LENGTH=298 /DNA_ID=CAMNT_0000580045 /DNA_START=76 /DNA_END=969 /DNA_ORIENTATION=+ /assembly_acc=CAM_ASM_000170
MSGELAAGEVELLRPVFGNLYVAQNMRTLLVGHARSFRQPQECTYQPYCDDFGPMNIGSVYRFNEALKNELNNSPDSNQKVIFKVNKGRRALSNAVFLLGSYMILEQNTTVAEVMCTFSWLDSTLVEAFRDATYVVPDFELSIADCWRGLAQGVRFGWVKSKFNSNPDKPMKVNLQVYEHFDNPLNGDLHEVVPDALIAFASPVDIPDGQEYYDDRNGYRRFSPHYYARAFSMLGVTDIVQLNHSTYDTSPFMEKGITIHQLPFTDCTCPSEDIVDAFLRIVDQANGLVAVHCRAGLG